MKKVIVTLLLTVALIVPTSVSAGGGLSQQQIQAILGLLQSFGADQNAINNVAQALGYSTPQSQVSTPATLVNSRIVDLPATVSLIANPNSYAGDNSSFYQLPAGTSRTFMFTMSAPSGSSIELHIARNQSVDGNSAPGPFWFPATVSLTADPNSYAGDTSSYFVIPAGTVRSFSFTMSDGGNNRTLLVQRNQTINGYTTNGYTATSPTQSLSATCAGYASTSGIGARWGASPIGGSGSYNFSWSVYNDPTNYIDGNTTSPGFTANYSSTGTKQAAVRVGDGNTTVTATCSTDVTAPSSSPSAQRLDNASLFGAVLKAFSFTAQ
ncbi:MAG: hypothetical protein EXS50_01235 [Candidatus Taylorbacteria bacterium]|nr:hypothetical protein [Candidatus Taylorbacteria bacterium]